MNIKIDTPAIALKQGDLDELCGIYAILNAIRLAVSQDAINTRKQRSLIKTALQYLSKREMLQETLLYGMSSRNFVKLANKLVERSNLITSDPLIITPFSDNEELQEKFIQTQLSRNAPVCARLKGRFDHYTVISGITDTRYLLTDSNGLSWINRSSLRADAGSNSARFRIPTRCLFSISKIRAKASKMKLTGNRSKRLWEIE